MLEKFRKNNKKGFTLVELIVVLVILAVLAALLVPALTGYIDKAKEKQIVAETRQIVMAAQTLVDEQYAKLAQNGEVTFVKDSDKAESALYAGEVHIASIRNLSEISGLILQDNVTQDGGVSITASNGKISKVVYRAHGLECTYENDDYLVKPAS